MGSLALAAVLLSSAIAAAGTTAVPGAESGRVDEGDHDSALRVVGRTLLFVPRVVVMLAAAPVRTILFAVEHYELETRFTSLFFSDNELVGLYPTAQIDSDYGISLGARFVHRDLFGAREHLSLRVNRGGRYRDRVGVELRSNDRFGERVSLVLSGELDRRPKERFYGIGNLDDAPEVRHRQQLARARGILDVRAADHLHLRGAAALSEIEYGRSDKGPPIDEVYSERQLPGWDGARELYGELEVRWDTRGRTPGWDLPKLLSTGELASAFLGRAHRLDASSDFWRYGVDLQHFLRLGEGPRVLVGRFHGEGVTGDLASIPFTELPQLGGKVLLRGYPIDRFRDRVAAVGTIEYRWDLSYRIPLDRFALRGPDSLCFDDLAIVHGFSAAATTAYTVTRYDRGGREVGGAFAMRSAGGATCVGPLTLSPGPDGYTIVRIETSRPGFSRSTDVHLARDPISGVPRIIGIWRS